MIRIDSCSMTIAGEVSTLLTEITTVLHNLYFEMKDSMGEEEANECMVEIGRLSVMPDEEFKQALAEESV